MAQFEASNVNLLADDLGISNLSSESSDILIKDAEYKIREILETAQKFQRRAFREKLSSGDVLKSLKLYNLGPVYGFPA
jgi:transcription initiation factor TFIID subunit 6